MSQDPVKALEAYLLDRGWPDDHRFETLFINFPLYQRGYAREMLETLERARGHKEPADLQNAQIEHILPQTLSDSWHEALGPNAERIQADWLHCPGNLTLSAYNQELWNHPFENKRLRYAESNIVLTRELAAHRSWTEEEIRERGRLLAQEAAQIWIGPKEQVTRAQPEDGNGEESPGRRELRRRFWSGLNDYLATEHPELPGFDPRPNWTVRLPSGIRHIGIELRFSLRHDHAGIDVWFWRDASFAVWGCIHASQQQYNELVNANWEFEQIEGRSRARMFIEQSVVELRNESLWPDIYQWIGQKLSLIYDRLVPRLRQEMDRNEVHSRAAEIS